MIRVVIADDQTLVREGMKRILDAFPEVEVVGEAATGDEVLPLCEASRPGVLLLDVSMPGRPFLETLGQLETQLPDLRVLVLSMHSEDQYAVRSLKAGAAGYLTKNHDPETLLEAIRRVHVGHKFVTPRVAERLALDLRRASPQIKHEILSDREFEVMVLLAQGSSVKNIGHGLNLSPKTVSTYRARVFEKMDFANSAELVRYAVDNDLVV